MTIVAQNVATNVCGPLPPTVPVNIDCSLCAIGFPQAGGTIGVSFYGPICPPSTNPSPSYWLGAGTKYAPFRCPNPGEDTELDPNTWVAEATFAGISSGSCANQYKFRAVLVALNNYQISVSVTVYVLTPTTGGNYWATYLSWSETLTEIVNLDTTRYRGRAFASPTYRSVSPASLGGIGDPVSFAKMIVGLQSMRLGCGSTAYALPDCGLWNGNRWLTCLRAEIQSTSTTNIREFTQLGFETAGCGTMGTSYCLCDRFTLTGVSPPVGTAAKNADPQFITDYGVLGIAAGAEAIGVEQEIQVAAGTTCGIQVVAKEIGGTIYICTNDNGAGWVCSTAVQAQANSPHILTATRAAFEVFLYSMQFPNPNILAEACGNGGTYPTPNPETDPWWCTPEGCAQSFFQPDDATGGPYATFSECADSCEAETGFMAVYEAPQALEQSEDFTPMEGQQLRAGIMAAPDRARLVERIKLLLVEPCPNLGLALETVATCGCAGGALHQCSVYGTCRTKGAIWNNVPSCWDCGSDPRLANLGRNDLQSTI